MIKLIESQYKEKISSLVDSHNMILKELTDKNRVL